MAVLAVATVFSERDYLFEKQAIDRIRAEHRPEDIAGLRWDKAPKGKPFIRIENFHLERSMREGGLMACCPICSPKTPKYLEGFLAFYPEEGVYRAIGNECSISHVGGEQARAADREYRIRKENERNSHYLMHVVGLLPAMIDALKKAELTAGYAEEIWRDLGRAGPVRNKLRKEMKANDGYIRFHIEKVTPIVDPETKEVEYDRKIIPVDLGLMTGRTMLQKELRLVGPIKNAMHGLLALQRAMGDDPEAWVIDNVENNVWLKQARAFIDGGETAYVEARTASADLVGFFTEPNFKRINDICRLREWYPSVWASVGNNEYIIRYAGDHQRTMRARPDFAALTDLPAWPSLEQKAPARPPVQEAA